MGHFSHCCKLSGLPITGGTPVVLFPMIMRDKLFDNSEDKLRKYGKTYMCSNEGTRLKFIPNMFPILGDYNDYGGIENIIEDDNTKALEKYFGLTIQQICDIICCGRKDDGYSDDLAVIKDPKAKDEYGKPKYQERYKELLSLSGMWVHREVYMNLTDTPTDSTYDKLDLGTPSLLESLGFVELTGEDLPKLSKAFKGNREPKRYNRAFKQGDLIVWSDGTWLGTDSIYRLSDFAKYCKDNGVTIDISQHDKKDYVEQMFDYVVPKYDGLVESKHNDKDVEAIVDEVMKDEKRLGEIKKRLDINSREELVKTLTRAYSMTTMDDMQMRMSHYFLNTERYGSHQIKNPLTDIYFNLAKEGKIRDNMVRFWRFDSYMFACGRFYDIVGTSPQDGSHELVMNVLNVASNILIKEVKERYSEEED